MHGHSTVQSQLSRYSRWIDQDIARPPVRVEPTLAHPPPAPVPQVTVTAVRGGSALTLAVVPGELG